MCAKTERQKSNFHFKQRNLNDLHYCFNIVKNKAVKVQKKKKIRFCMLLMASDKKEETRCQ